MGAHPRAFTIRAEALLNAFEYDGAEPGPGEPFAVASELGPCPWSPARRRHQVTPRAAPVTAQDLPPRTLVSSLDASRSMRPPDRLPMVHRVLRALGSHLRAQDQLEFDPQRPVSHRLVGDDNRRLNHWEVADDAREAGELRPGHRVTAPVGLELRGELPPGTSLGRIRVRCERPGEQRGRLRRQPLAVPLLPTATSVDLRFASAVAGFSGELTGPPELGRLAWAELYALTEASLGPDPTCQRHDLLERIALAMDVDGEPPPDDPACPSGQTATASEPLEDPPATAPDARAPVLVTSQSEPPSGDAAAWRAVALEVLRLVPPLAALPLFVLAWFEPRRRRRTRGRAGMSP